MQTISEYTQTNILVIPQALFGMKDVAVLRHHGDSAIFYKNLEKDLADVEFYTNNPCFIYVDSGREVITNSDNETMVLCVGSAIFLPQGLNLHSDFVKKTESLSAYLVFFDDDVITEYLSKAKIYPSVRMNKPSFCKVQCGSEFKAFFESICHDVKDPEYLKVKLQELLHLIDWKDNSDTFKSLLATSKRVVSRRNITRLIEKYDVLHFSVSDLAHISGRSLSSFNRDFKAAYNMPPKQWLTEKRLTRAKELLQTKERTVTEVAIQVGYENVSHFIKAFKTKYGITPKQLKACD